MLVLTELCLNLWQKRSSCVMNWKKIVVVILIFTACNKEEPKVEWKNSEKKVRIDKIDLFGSANGVEAFYAQNQFKAVWNDSVNRSELISAVIDSRFDGVLPETYPLGSLIFAHQQYQRLKISELKKADIRFTEVFFKIADQLSFGKVNPKKLYGDWEPYVHTIDKSLLLNESLQNQKVYHTLEDLKPKGRLYQTYKKAFEKYVPVTSKDTLSEFGKMRKKIWVNLERSKWLPDDLGEHYVWINLPEYRLQLVDQGQIKETHKIIIGKKERRTPVLSSSFNNIIFNPKWTVPPTILKEDIVPKASTDRSYFEANRLTIYDKKTGKVVEPEEWNPENYSSYRYVQQTGRLNSLGQVKFDFPNNHMVYLHDTNNRSMFNRSNRSLSSGCIRVEAPFDLAEAIFEIEEINVPRSEIDTLVQRETTKSFKLNKKVNVHQVYFTAVIDTLGNIQVFDDIYSLDKKLYQELMN